jgi:hypothetical protein
MDLKTNNEVMKLNRFLLVVLTLSTSYTYAQFPGAAGTTGSTAIHKDSSIFVAWGTTCSVQRGLQQINDISLGYTTTGDSTMATGHADGVQVVSLGDGGSAIIGFEKPIKNGPGFDFAVFENGFIDEFLELAFVEVSSDGNNFFRFKATSNTQIDLQMGPFDYNANPSLMNNLAGKYRAMYGTPFDLEEMTGIAGLNVDSITHVKVIDVVGCIDPLYASYDQHNHIINEHFPTPYPQGGFDLDAVGVIYQQVNGISESEKTSLDVYPNPFNDLIYFNISAIEINLIEIADQYGHIRLKFTNIRANYIDLSLLESGAYFIKLHLKNDNIIVKKIIKLNYSDRN